MKASVPSFYAKDRAAWREWLAQHASSEPAVWLVYDKGAQRTLSWADIVQEALCFGWIDSKPGTVSDTQSKLYISRRKPKSAWSKINKAHVDELISAGLMTPAGQSAIDIAKQNGSWDALNKSDALELPDELAALFAAHPVAAANFAAFSVSARRAILEWIYSAKTDATRHKRIQETFDKATLNQKANRYVPK